ncbi:CPBP family intramembrane metalloprotease [Kribbella sp. NBC_01505]|uniref:CPBP family glutamic-type intramembrane protease n=1 Tax=Kribbella sp. NBC_01505 TaxID=2903580 RepID=UPI00386D359A
MTALQEKTTTRRRLVEFGVICLVLTWVPYLFLGVLKVDIDQPVGRLIFGLAASGPSLAALVMWLRYRDRRRGVRWSPSWMIAAVLMGVAAPLAATAISGKWGELSGHASAEVAGIGGVLAAAVYTLVAGPLAEEFGWRGYVQPRLRQYFGLRATTAILGTAWWLWHVPLFFLPGTGQHEGGLFTQFGLIFFLEIFPLTFLMLFVTERLRGGVPAAILLHSAWNLTTELIPPLGNGVWIEFIGLTAVAAGAAVYWRRTLPA